MFGCMVANLFTTLFHTVATGGMGNNWDTLPTATPSPAPDPGAFYNSIYREPPAARDPMDILGGTFDGRSYVTDAQTEMESYVRVYDIYHILMNIGVMAGVLVLLFTFISMLFVTRSEKLGEKKDQILHILKIIFLMGSLITILGLMAMVAQGVLVPQR